MSDPFLSAQSDVLSLLAQSRSHLSSYLRIRSTSSQQSPELHSARTDLETSLYDLSADLQDLVDSVNAVEGDPRRYGLTPQEVNRRRGVVNDVKGEVEEMQRQLEAQVEQSPKELAHPDAYATEDGDPLAGQDEDDYGAWEEQRQMELMHEQDEALDGVFATVGNLRMQADSMGRELEEQAELLEETEGITDRVGGKLAKGMKGIRFVIEKNEGKLVCSCEGTRRKRIGCGYEAVLTVRLYRSLVWLLHCSADLRTHPAAGLVAGALNA